MRLFAEFFRGLMALRRPWIVWIGLLMAANGIAPLFFLGTVEGRVVLAAGLIGMAVQLAILKARGFVRLLGIGHAPWLVMLPWLAMRLESAPEASMFAWWITAVLVLNFLSLLIDIAEVVRYLRGERAPMA